MARDGSGVYSKPASTTAVDGQTITASLWNTMIDDLVADANVDRPIAAGGTGASSAAEARLNLFGAAQLPQSAGGTGATTLGAALVTPAGGTQQTLASALAGISGGSGGIVTLSASAGDGATDNTTVIQGEIDALTALGGGVLGFGPGVFRTDQITLADNVVLLGSGQGATIFEPVDSATGPLFTTTGAAEYLDEVSRNFTGHTSTTARNAQGYDTGQIIFINASDFGDPWGATSWWRATADNATTDADWEAIVNPLGCYGGGLMNLKLRGRGQAIDGVAYYGFEPRFQGIHVEDFGGWGIKAGAMAGVFSPQVRRNLQGVWRDISIWDCGAADQGNFYFAGKTDTTFEYLMIYEPKNTGYGILIGALSGGFRIIGSHFWGNDFAEGNFTHNYCLYAKAGAGDISDSHAEGRVRITGPRNRLDMKIYKGFGDLRYAAADETGAAVVANDLSQSFIRVRSYLFQTGVYLTGTAGNGNVIESLVTNPGGSSTKAIAGASLNSTDTTLIAKNAEDDTDSIMRVYGETRSFYNNYAKRKRPFAQQFASAASITPDASGSDYIKIAVLSQNMTINAPTNGVEGDELTFTFQQDATGGRSLTWNSAFTAGNTSSATAFKRLAVKYVYDGVKWIPVGGVGTWA